MDELITETPQAGENEEQIAVRLATVAEVTDDGLRLQFDGSDAATEKVYKCNASCMFVVGDRVKVTKHSGTYLVDYVIGAPASAVHGIPAGGAAGYVLKKQSNSSYDVYWGAAHAIPSGGSNGQVLAKSSDDNYAVSWVDAHGIPSGGSAGQVLAKSSATNYAVSWVDVSAAMLKSGTNTVELSGTTLKPNSSSISLGSSTYPFGELHANGPVTLGSNYKAVNIGAVNSTLGFFGHTAASRQSVASTATVATLITALKAYGLIL